MNEICRTGLLQPNVRIIIEGRTVILKPISRSQINARYISWLNDPEVNRFLEVRHKKQSVKDVIDYINSLRAKKGCELFAVLTKREHIHIGNIAITDYNSNNQGYAIYGTMIGDLRAQMLGLGGEATTLMVEYLFRSPAIRRVQAGAISDNHRSWKTLEFLGFKKEGILRKHAVLSSGEINDVYIYGMLRREWFDNRRKVANILRNIKIAEHWETKL